MLLAKPTLWSQPAETVLRLAAGGGRPMRAGRPLRRLCRGAGGTVFGALVVNQVGGIHRVGMGLRTVALRHAAVSWEFEAAVKHYPRTAGDEGLQAGGEMSVVVGVIGRVQSNR